jgi:PAS domain S-box-containing protein
MAMLGEEAREAELSIAEIAGRLHPDDVAPTFRELSRAQTCPDQRYDVEFRLRCRDGSYKWVRSAGRVVERGANAEPLRMIGYHIDIDARRRVEQQRAMLERHMHLLLEHTQAAIAMFDRDMRYVVASRGWYEQYGLGTESIVGRSHYEVFPDLPAAWLEHHRRALAGEVLSCERDSFQRADGSTTHLTWALHPWRDASDRIGGIVMFTQVVDEQVRHEQGLRDARDAAIAASRARGEFLANMSHEIRTPMTAILGFADQLELEPHRLGEYVEIIRRNGHHLMGIVDALLDLSKIDAGKMSVEVAAVESASLVEDVRRMFQARAEDKGLTLAVDVDARVPAQFGCDPLRLRQILTNLVGNAVKFTPSGSVVLRIRANEDGRRLVFEVEDTGIGMSPEQMQRVFEPFEQGDASTTRRFGGTGLGLCISRRLAGLLGGTLVVESRPGVGTLFRLELPLVGAPAPRVDTTDAPAPALPTRSLAGRRVLLAEDGADNRRLVGLVLSRAGAAFRTVENGSLVVPELERAQAAGEPFDLVLMDMQMPEVDGYAATAEVRRAGFELPVVALTAHAMAGDRERCLSAGCDGYLTKPIDRAELVAVLAALFDRAAARRP